MFNVLPFDTVDLTAMLPEGGVVLTAGDLVVTVVTRVPSVPLPLVTLTAVDDLDFVELAAPCLSRVSPILPLPALEFPRRPFGVSSGDSRELCCCVDDLVSVDRVVFLLAEMEEQLLADDR